MTHSGKLEWFWIALEDTRWVAKAPSLWLKQIEANFQDSYENSVDESAVWNIINSVWSERTKEMAEWEISVILSANSIWYFLTNIIWTPTSVETVWTWAYQHSFANEDVNTKRSLTFSKKTPLTAKQYALWMLASLWISTKVWESIIAKFNAKSKAWADWTLTKAFAMDSKFYAKHLKVYVADTLAWLDWASATCLESFEFNFLQTLEDDYCIWNGVELNDLFNTDLQTEISVERKKKDSTFEDRAKSLDYKAMRVEIIDTTKTIWVSDNPTIRIDIARHTIEEYESSWALNEIVKESFKVKAHYDEENDKYIDIDLINEVSSY